MYIFWEIKFICHCMLFPSNWLSAQNLQPRVSYSLQNELSSYRKFNPNCIILGYRMKFCETNIWRSPIISTKLASTNITSDQNQQPRGFTNTVAKIVKITSQQNEEKIAAKLIFYTHARDSSSRPQSTRELLEQEHSSRQAPTTTANSLRTAILDARTISATFNDVFAPWHPVHLWPPLHHLTWRRRNSPPDGGGR